MRLSLLFAALPVASASLLLACSDDSPSSPDTTVDGGGGDGGGNEEGPAPFGLPRLSELEAGSFSFLEPGGDTTCALGGAYGFAVRPGDPNKVVVEFEGGGACWEEATCNGPASGGGVVYYKDTVRGAQYTRNQPGLRDHDNDDNPTKGWTHVVVPYCSADIHWGDKESTYGSRTIQHRGKRNTSAVLEWVYSQVKAPERIFVTGCSAGGYGSIYWTPALQGRYPNAKVKQFSDSAAGVIPPTYFSTLQDSWNLQGTFPTDVGNPAEFTSLAYLYSGIATKYPNIFLSQYNTASDSVQAQFYLVMGGVGWNAQMRTNLNTLISQVPQYRNYLSDGDVHCIIEEDGFYSKTIGDTKLTDWLKKVVNDENVDNVACPDCL